MKTVVEGRTPMTLTEALDAVEAAKACIRQNAGLERELAEEAYEAAVTEDLLPALLDCIEDEMTDAKDIIAVAKFVQRRR